MKYFLDTNICIYALNRRSDIIRQSFENHLSSDISLSVITVAELRYGASYSAHPERNHRQLDDFFPPFTILAWDEEAAKSYGVIVSDLRRKGTPISTMDALIAAHALSKNAILVTNNMREFQRVPGLICENWL